MQVQPGQQRTDGFGPLLERAGVDASRTVL